MITDNRLVNGNVYVDDSHEDLFLLVHYLHLELLENDDSVAILEGLKYKCIADDHEKVVITSDVPLVNVYDLTIQLIKVLDSFGWREVLSLGILFCDRKRIFYCV